MPTMKAAIIAALCLPVFFAESAVYAQSDKAPSASAFIGGTLIECRQRGCDPPRREIEEAGPRIW